MADMLNNSSITENIINSFSISDAFNELKPLMLFIAGIVIYAVFIYKFYHFIARKDILGLNLHDRGESGRIWLKKIIQKLFYFLENIIIIPLLVLFWFLILALLLLFLSKNHNIQTILLISMALVGAVRITAFINEDLSMELAKLMPLVLLGVFLADISFFSVVESINKAEQVVTVLQSVIYYYIFIVVLEFILRIISIIFKRESFQRINGL
ncbi:MAG: hypothetical protein QXG00_02200 [Candidatus Woesearchaeota archaeon]